MVTQRKQTSSGSDDSIIIAVMGCTGSGKSSFIKLISGDESVQTGKGLESMTVDVKSFDFVDPKSGRNVTVVDTPGFDDSKVSDTEILKRITAFLLEEYDAQRKLNGLVYLHRISDPRFGGQSKRNLRMFKELCGSDTFKNVVVLTTFWDKVSQQEGIERVSEMKSNFFQPLVQEGAKFMPHDRTFDSAQRVLDHIITLVPTNVRITEEIRVEGKKLEDTGAGSVHREELDALIAKHKKELVELQTEMNELRGSNNKLRQELAEDKAEMQKKLAKWEEDRDNLTRGLETETAARKTLEGTVEEHRQWRIKQEQDSVEAEKTARKNLETIVEQERELRITQASNHQARIEELERRHSNDCIIM